MTTIIAPYRPTSPLHVPRRDLVIAGAASLALRVSIVADDTANAAALELTGGIGGPALRMVIWRDSPRTAWDYGAPAGESPEVLWTGTGTIAADAPGSFDIAMPQGTASDWPRRCGFHLYLDWDGGMQSELLAMGSLHLVPAFGTPALTAEPVLTDAADPVTEDDLDPVTTT